MASVSQHAIQRYTERVSPVSQQEALAQIISHERAIDQAADFGCETVICGDGTRLKLKGDVVTTVLGRQGY
jgi:hypothetical protein